MRVRMAAVLAVAVALAGGCSEPGTPKMTPAVPMSGNWQFSAVNGSNSSAFPLLVAGSLMMNGDKVSADFLSGLITQCAISASPDLVLTGTVSNSSLSMTSTAWDGTIFTVTGTVSSDGQSISGKWSGKGGCADGQSGSISLQYIPPVTGTWTGVLGAVPALPGLPASSPGGLGGATINFQFQQSATPVQFSFPLNGTVSVSGSTCGFGSGTLIQINPIVPLAPSSVTGPFWNVEATMSDGSQMIGTGGRSALTGQWTAVVDVIGGVCDGAEAQATLTGPSA